MLNVFYNRDSYQVIIIKKSNEYIHDVAAFDKEYSDKVVIVDCDAVESAQDVMLEYANGICFLEIDKDFSFEESSFDKLLYDANLCDEDSFKYIRNKYTYIMLGSGDNRFLFYDAFELKCLTDYRDNAGNIDKHYFFQDIYVASKVRAMGISHIYDIGSRVDGYIAHLLSMGIAVTMIDVRPLDIKVKGLDFVQGNATELSGIKSESLDYLSCLHALEHFGLGRYGDPVNYYGWIQALEQYKRVLRKHGMLFLSMPVGRTERVCFNAHRVFRPLTIVQTLFPDMRLLEFTCIYDGKTTTLNFENSLRYDKTCEVLEEYTNILGEYVCGIFVFERC